MTQSDWDSLYRDYMDRMWNAQKAYDQAQQQRLAATQQAYLQNQLGAQPLGAQPHGRHRPPSQALHGSPAGVAPSRARGGARGPITSAFTSVRPPWAEPEPPPAIEEAGIRAGEIVAWRVWRLEERESLWDIVAGHQIQIQQTPLLRSVYKRTIWKPGQTMKAHADPTTQRYDRAASVNSEFVGIFAWKTLGALYAYMQEYAQPYLGKIHQLFVIGQVILWGSVIEHERGYRAQFAKPHRLFMVGDAEGTSLNEGLRVELCRLYGLPEEGV